MTSKLELIQAHGALVSAHADMKQLIDGMPWKMPVILPVAPTTSGAVLTNRVSIPTTASTYQNSGKKFQGVPLGYKLEAATSSPFDFGDITLLDIELASSNVGFRSYGAGIIRNLRIERMRLATGIFTQGIPSGLIYSQGTRLESAIFRDLFYNCSQGITDGTAIVGAFVLAGKSSADVGNDILLENFDFRNLVITGTSAYPNSDGVSIESGYNNVTIKNGVVINVSDGCYDIKCVLYWLDNIFGQGGRQTLKLWNPSVLGAIYSADPRFAHLLLTKETGGAWAKPLVIEHLSCRNSSGTQPIIRCEDGMRQIIIKSYDLSGCKPGTPLISKDTASAASTIDWGPQGVPQL